MSREAAAFRPIIEAPREEGFPVTAIDRLGYGRSSKPLIHDHLHIPARNTKSMARVRVAQRQILYEDPVVYEWQHFSSKALVIFPAVGHAPVFEIPGRFHAELIRFSTSDPHEPADQNWRATDVGTRP